MFPAISLGFTIFGDILCMWQFFNPTIEIVTFLLCGSWQVWKGLDRKLFTLKIQVFAMQNSQTDKTHRGKKAFESRIKMFKYNCYKYNTKSNFILLILVHSPARSLGFSFFLQQSSFRGSHIPSSRMVHAGCFCCWLSPIYDINVRIFWVSALEGVHPETRSWPILLFEREGSGVRKHVNSSPMEYLLK